MKEILKNFLNAYWLRPETALWRTLDVEAMRTFKVTSPSLDLGCGDGTFSFIRAGGGYEDDFDVFLNVDNLDKYWENVDIYDAYEEHKEEKKLVKKIPEYKIDMGLDHKINLINKARRLNFYNDFKEFDANKILPFKDNSFQSVFSNIIYWLDSPDQVFKEIFRILKKDGICCVMLPNITYLEGSFYYTLYEKSKRKEFEFLKLIDRGRISDNLKIVNTYSGWKEIIEGAGFEIEECIPHLSKTLIQIWDIGLRPLFPLLKEMTTNIKKDVLLEIKREWVDLFLSLCYPIIENEKLLTQNKEFCFFCFLLRK